MQRVVALMGDVDGNIKPLVHAISFPKSSPLWATWIEIRTCCYRRKRKPVVALMGDVDGNLLADRITEAQYQSSPLWATWIEISHIYAQYSSLVVVALMGDVDGNRSLSTSISTYSGRRPYGRRGLK